MASPDYRIYYKDIGRVLTHHDVGKAIVRTLPFRGDRFFMVPKIENCLSVHVTLLSIDLNGLLCEAKSGDYFRIDGIEAFEAAYLPMQEFLMKIRQEHMVAKRIIKNTLDI